MYKKSPCTKNPMYKKLTPVQKIYPSTKNLPQYKKFAPRIARHFGTKYKAKRSYSRGAKGKNIAAEAQ